METIETAEHRGYKILIGRDDDPLHPRKDWDNLGHMICFHRRYDLGDEHQFSHTDYDGWEAMKEHFEKECGAVIILPLYLYDHSGITMSVGSFGDRWDSGQVGFIYAKRDEILKWYGKKLLTRKLRARAEQGLRQEVKNYDDFLTGAVYEMRILGPDGVEVEDTSVSGYYGEIKDLLQEGRQEIDRLLDKEIRPGT